MKQNFTGSWFLKKVDASQQRGFTRSAGTDNADNFSFCNGKVNVTEHFIGTKILFQVLNINDRLFHFRHLPFL
ncbi:hypothetical protein SDC9_137121 [bioreactor metagenome]|uniref:Uncharacterized protein n=1 Tax=bioreactor metagenome TaxID=1076179 RepID=A0A645DL52_9ZZZZ